MMSQSFAVYPSNCAGAESKNAYLQAQFHQSSQDCFWSPADQSAFHQYAQYGSNYYYNYSELDEAQTNHAWLHAQQHGYDQFAQEAQQNGYDQVAQEAGVQCCVNLADFSDFSDSEEEEEKAPAKSAVKPVLPKSTSTDSVRLDDSTSTDAGSSDTESDACSSPKASSTEDASSTTNASDSSDTESEACSSPKASNRTLHSRDALLLLRIAVGMCANPPARWSTQPREGDGSEWRNEAASKQASNGKTKLVASPNSWGAQQIKLARAGPKQSDEEIVRGMKSILNKLTLEKFDALYEKLINCGISNDAHIKLLVHEIFDKACLQHQFVDMYADLCMRLEKWLESAQTETTSNEFRRILLNQCQESFEASIAPSADHLNDLAAEELLEAKMRHKQRVLGNVRLIAALLVRGMLAPRVLMSVAQTLLKDTSEQDALESLAVFLTNVGPKFDVKTWPYHAQLCSVFDKVQELTKSKEVAPRLRFLLKDVLDLRATSWADMKKATKKNEGPMKLEEVHQKAAVEEKAQMQAPRTQRTNKKDDDRSLTLKDLKAACTSKPATPKTNQVDKKPGTLNQADKKPGTPKANQADKKKDGQEQKAKQNKKAPVAPSSPAATQYHGSALQLPKVVAPESPAKAVQQANAPFDLRAFRRQLNEILKELSATRDTVSAFRRLDGLQVPLKFQTNEFSNLLTRIAEERCGASRRVMWAFSASLAGKTFDSDMCANGIKSFFDDVFEDLCEEVPRLSEILKNELVPTLSATVNAEKLSKSIPASLK